MALRSQLAYRWWHEQVRFSTQRVRIRCLTVPYRPPLIILHACCFPEAPSPGPPVLTHVPGVCTYVERCDDMPRRIYPRAVASLALHLACLLRALLPSDVAGRVTAEGRPVSRALGGIASTWRVDSREDIQWQGSWPLRRVCGSRLSSDVIPCPSRDEP